MNQCEGLTRCAGRTGGGAVRAAARALPGGQAAAPGAQLPRQAGSVPRAGHGRGCTPFPAPLCVHAMLCVPRYERWLKRYCMASSAFGPYSIGACVQGTGPLPDVARACEFKPAVLYLGQVRVPRRSHRRTFRHGCLPSRTSTRARGTSPRLQSRLHLDVHRNVRVCFVLKRVPKL